MRKCRSLQEAFDENAKNLFISCTSAIYARVDAVVEEIRAYYLFTNVPDSLVIGESGKSFKHLLMGSTTATLQLSTALTQSGKLSSGVWFDCVTGRESDDLLRPPPNAGTEMMAGMRKVAVAVRKIVDFSQEAAKIIRKTESNERKDMEVWMRDWLQNAKVRDLFSHWQQAQLAVFKVNYFSSL